MDRAYPRDVPLYRPLSVEPGPLAGKLHGQEVNVFVHVYDVGVVAISMRVTFTCLSLLDLLSFHNPRLENGQSLDELSRAMCLEVYRGLQGAMVRSSSPSEPEAYTTFCVTDLGDDVRDVNQWLTEQRRAVAGLLAETEPAKLSEDQVTESLRLRRSYESTDLVVIDWDAALAVDLSGYVDDVIYILELANVQLEELRTMDLTLDRFLNRAYDDLENRPFSMWGRANKVLVALRWFRVDFTKLADEVTHIMKFLGDWYLARVYLAARERFYLEPVAHQRRSAACSSTGFIARRMRRSMNGGMLWLEIIVVVFFAIDLLAIFFLKK